MIQSSLFTIEELDEMIKRRNKGSPRKSGKEKSFLMYVNYL